jgi:catechol 2,3-dioxygenase-like lactoylglutathione lyase family enzyme
MTWKIERIFHINVVCRDLERSLKFYTDVVGMHIVEGPYEVDGPRLTGIGQGSQAWGVDPSAVAIKFVFLRFGDDPDETILDLLEFVSPRSYGAPHPTLQKIGIARIALKVDDVQASYNALLEKGAKFLTPPISITIGEDLLDDIAYACFYDPDGTILELYGKNPKKS